MTNESVTKEEDVLWAAVGNIKKTCFIGPRGREAKPGTKHFRAAAKIYVIDAFWGTCDSVTVIGQHRSSKRLICVAMPAKHIENLRPRIIYSPTVIRLAREHFGPDRQLPKKEDAEQICLAIPSWVT